MFAGIWTLTRGASPADFTTHAALSKALAPMHRPDREGLWQADAGLLLSQRVFNSPFSYDESLPLVCAHSGAALAFWGRLDNRSELAAALGMGAAQTAALTDSALALAAWRHWGEALPEQLLGDFALAVIDPQRRQVFLARDAVGVKPLYYRLDDQLFAFATTAAALKCLRGVPLTPDREWIARYLLDLLADPAATGYREIKKLPPGHCMTLGENGHVTLRRWHHWRDDSPDAATRDPRWVEQYRSVLEESIRCRMPSNYPLGTENSGGIDSATITAYLARFLGTPGDQLHSFAFALTEQEPAYILEISQAAGIVHNYVVTSIEAEAAEVERRLEHNLQVLGYPEEHAIGSDHTLFYREAQARGIRTLYSGFGGDEVVTNPAHQVRLEMLDAGHYHTLQGMLRGNSITRRLRVAKMLLEKRRPPTHNSQFLHARQEQWAWQPLRAEVVAEYGLKDALFATAVYDAPYRRVNDFILQFVLPEAFIPARLESCTLAAAAYGVEYRWPLWDTRLIQQYLSTPGIEKRGPDHVGRYLHRRAVDGVVPHRVAWKQTKDMGAATATTRNPQVGRQGLTLLANLHADLAEIVDVAQLQRHFEQAQRAPNASEASADSTLYQLFVDLSTLNHWLHSHAGAT
jgi:asparagine synthase (glutamine-hydrolysing)